MWTNVFIVRWRSATALYVLWCFTLRERLHPTGAVDYQSIQWKLKYIETASQETSLRNTMITEPMSKGIKQISNPSPDVFAAAMLKIMYASTTALRPVGIISLRERRVLFDCHLNSHAPPQVENNCFKRIVCIFDLRTMTLRLWITSIWSSQYWNAIISLRLPTTCKATSEDRQWHGWVGAGMTIMISPMLQFPVPSFDHDGYLHAP